MNKSEHVAETKPKRRPWMMFLAFLLVVLAGLPWTLAKTSLRNQLLTAIVDSDDVSVAAEGASFGYLTPMSIETFELVSNDNSTTVSIPKIQAEHSWLKLWMARPDLGTFQFVSPRVELIVDPDELAEPQPAANDPIESPEEVELPNLSAEIRQASIAIRTPESSEPTVDLENVSFTLHIRREPSGATLTVDPTTIFDRQRLTPELCGQGLQLIAPMLADEIDAEGEFSLRLEKFHFPVGSEELKSEKDVQIEGELQLHSAKVSLRHAALAKDTSDLILQLIGTAAPEKLTVAKDLVVNFQVIDGRVHHEGLALLLPYGESSIQLASSGSVGFDESLDLQVEVGLPAELVGGGRLGALIAKGPLSLSITGTIDEPTIDLTNRSSLVDSIKGLLGGNKREP